MNSYEDLLNYIAIRINSDHLDAIVVEGYDGVGKGKILNLLANTLGVIPYRPDYNLWQEYDHRQKDRWKVSGFFWDVYSHFMEGEAHRAVPMLFDRGVLSGAVYNPDPSIAEHYKDMIRDRNILHIIVTCTEEDYDKFARLRKAEIVPSYKTCKLVTDKYIRYMELAGADFIVYENIFDEDEAERLATTCAGCGHYNYGWCRHPDMNCRVDANCIRCEKSSDKEIQDKIYN